MDGFFSGISGTVNFPGKNPEEALLRQTQRKTALFVFCFFIFVRGPL